VGTTAVSARQISGPDGTTGTAGGWRSAGRGGPLRHSEKDRSAASATSAGSQAARGHAELFAQRERAHCDRGRDSAFKDGQFIPGLKQDNFRVLEDGVPQPITSFGQTQAPITAVLLIEFANSNYTMAFLADALRAAYAFADGLKKDDWVAVIEYDMKPNILLDFTQDKAAVFGALNKLRVPGFSERNLFDALYDTLDRIDRIKGRKEVIVIASGMDTFSKITYDRIQKKIKETPNVTIFTVSTGRAFNEWLDARYGTSARGQIRSLDYLQADNQMRTFAQMTGGRWYNPRFQAEFPEAFRDISNSVRNQYTISFKPTNQKLDGSYRKLKVQLVEPGTDKPLTIRDRKNKELKYSIISRDGYTARRPVE